MNERQWYMAPVDNHSYRQAVRSLEYQGAEVLVVETLTLRYDDTIGVGKDTCRVFFCCTQDQFRTVQYTRGMGRAKPVTEGEVNQVRQWVSERLRQVLKQAVA